MVLFLFSYLYCLIYPHLICVSSLIKHIYLKERGFPGGAVVESLPANAGDTGSSPGLGRSHMPRSNWAQNEKCKIFKW